jgi:hypothetical protein
MKIKGKLVWTISIASFLFIISAVIRDNLANVILFFVQNDYSNYLISYADGIYGGEVSRTLLNYVSIIITLIVIPIFTYNLSTKYEDKQNVFFALFVFYIFSAIINVQIIWFYRFMHLFQIIAFIVMANGVGMILVPKNNIVKKTLLLIMFVLYVYALVSNSIFGYDETFNQYRYELFVPYTLYF